MLRQILSGGSWYEIVAYLISSFVVLFLVLPLHECAHGFVAYKLGDPTAKYQQRLTLNPLHHIDWVGAAAILLVGFGWARPVPVNMRYFRRPKRDMALVALAGPLSNLLAALVSALICALMTFIGRRIVLSSVFAIQIYNLLIYLFLFLTQINVSLAVFNLIPLPPLDGSRLLGAFLPDRIYYRLMQYERYFSFLVLILCISGSVGTAVGKVTAVLTNAILRLAMLPFGLL